VVAGAALVVALVWWAGFDYLEGFAATRREVAESVQRTRPLALFVVLDLAVVGIAAGPAVVAALGRGLDRARWLLVGGALAAIGVADLTGLAKGEVERVWLPFTVWLLVAAGVHRERARPWLAVQVGTAVLIEVLARTTW
jgi:hypothetical protein